jgi:hypothetical protein
MAVVKIKNNKTNIPPVVRITTSNGDVKVFKVQK